MVAKLIVHGPTRDAALDRLVQALAAVEVDGLRTNLGLLRRVAAHPAFRAGAVETGFLAAYPEVLATDAAIPPEAVAAAALSCLPPSGSGPWDQLDSWRMNLEGTRTVALACGEATFDVVASPGTLAWAGIRYAASLDGTTLRLEGAVSRAVARRFGDEMVVVAGGVTTVFTVLDPLAPPREAAAAGGRVAAPIPGRVVAVLVAVGDEVQRGQKLVVVEAMKMELALTAPADGVVAAIACAVGDMVEEGRELVTLNDGVAAA